MRSKVLQKSLSIGLFLLFVGINVGPVQSTMMMKSMQTGIGSLFYVGGSGPGNYSKIQNAIDNASDGDIVFVYDDSSPYYENVLLQKSIHLIGEQVETTIIDGKKSCNVVSVFADGVSITGFTLCNSGVLMIDCGIELRSSHNTISGNIISNNFQGISLYTFNEFIANYNNITGNMITSNEGNGIYLLHSEYNHISGNILSNNTGITLDQSNNNNVSGNIFHNDGIFLNSFSNNIISDNLVNGKPLVYMVGESNKIVDTAGQIILVDCHNITIQHQDLSNTTTGLNLIRTDHCHIVRNTIMNNCFFGINLFQSNDNNISLNTFSHNSAGLQVASSDRNIIIWNTIRSNQPYYGIELYGSNNNTISTNTIEKNGGRKMVENGLGIFIFISSNNSIFHNNFLQNARDAYFNEAYSNEWNGNYWNRPRILPKIILGENAKLPPFDLRINFDWHPAQQPYDIPRMV